MDWLSCEAYMILPFADKVVCQIFTSLGEKVWAREQVDLGMHLKLGEELYRLGDNEAFSHMK